MRLFRPRYIDQKKPWDILWVVDEKGCAVATEIKRWQKGDRAKVQQRMLLFTERGNELDKSKLARLTGSDVWYLRGSPPRRGPKVRLYGFLDLPRKKMICFQAFLKRNKIPNGVVERGQVLLDLYKVTPTNAFKVITPDRYSGSIKQTDF